MSEEDPLIRSESSDDMLSADDTLSEEFGKTGRPAKRGVNALQLTMMIYFFTSGGPFGIEPAVGASGPLLTLISLIVVPLLWSLPQALMAAELSLMISENGGNVVWVRTAFGDTLGFFNAYANICSSISSLALLTVLFVDYIIQIPTNLSMWEIWLLKGGFILLNTVLNVLGLRWISRLSLGFLIFVLSPFICEFILVIMHHDLDVSLLKYTPPVHDIQWALFLSTVIWSYGGFDSMGSLAGEVKGGRKTFMMGIMCSFPLIFLNYFFPICFGYSVQSNWSLWQSGYFTTIADLVKTRGNYLGYWMVAASAISNFGQFNAAMAPMSRVIWSMAKMGYLPPIIGWSWQRHTGTVRPIAAVIFAGIICTAATAISFNDLVQVFLIIRVFNLFCEYAALIRLRYSMPDAKRPFVVPGGIVGVWLLGIPSLFLAVFTIAKSPPLVFECGAVVIGVTVISFFIRLAIAKYFPKNLIPAAVVDKLRSSTIQ